MVSLDHFIESNHQWCAIHIPVFVVYRSPGCNSLLLLLGHGFSGSITLLLLVAGNNSIMLHSVHVLYLLEEVSSQIPAAKPHPTFKPLAVGGFRTRDLCLVPQKGNFEITHSALETLSLVQQIFPSTNSLFPYGQRAVPRGCKANEICSHGMSKGVMGKFKSTVLLLSLTSLFPQL